MGKSFKKGAYRKAIAFNSNLDPNDDIRDRKTNPPPKTNSETLAWILEFGKIVKIDDILGDKVKIEIDQEYSFFITKDGGKLKITKEPTGKQHPPADPD